MQVVDGLTPDQYRVQLRLWQGIFLWYLLLVCRFPWLANLGARVFYSGHRRQKALDRKRKEEALKVSV